MQLQDRKIEVYQTIRELYCYDTEEEQIGHIEKMKENGWEVERKLNGNYSFITAYTKEEFVREVSRYT